MAIEKNQVVELAYTLRDPKTGEILDQSPEGNPLKFITGAGQIIPGLEKEIMQMNCGESKEILVKAADAYGEVNPNAFQTVQKSQLSNLPDLKEGMVLSGQDPQGHLITVRVHKIEGENVTLDLNHPMAGKDLLFEVKICDVRPATDEELAHGHVHDSENDCNCKPGCGCKH